jgi:predicted RNA binding protein YcfA (HicA-like mRNA interferase family)
VRSEAGRVVIVPMHRELRTGTLRSIVRQSGLDVDAFVELLG